MNEFTISGAMFKDMIITAAALLEQNKAGIDALNVFPVPDGDTGTNMSMTMQNAAKMVREAKSDKVCDIAAALAQGALRGARGNSGVILSQIFSGFNRALKNETQITAKLFVAMFVSGAETAYKAVKVPKEGTILTVVKMISEELKKSLHNKTNLYDLLDVMMKSGNEALLKTPELLPVLKEAGVVDSGGKGLMTVLKGFVMAINGEGVEDIVLDAPQTETNIAGVSETSIEVAQYPDTESIKYHYCTEFFVINLYNPPKEEEIERFSARLNQIGDSVVVAYDEGFIKCHVHTCVPGKALQLALHFGELDKVKIENMLEQNRALLRKRKETEKENAIIAISAGEGINQMFTALGASAIISGGQTMNPSIDSIATMIRKVNARNVFILPNNSNIILAAQQAANIADDVNVVVIPTKTIMQGISAIMTFNSDKSVNDNTKRMTDAAESVISGSVTYAVRSTVYDGKEIQDGDILGMLDNKISIIGKDVIGVSTDLLRQMIEKGETDSAVTILYGEDITEEQANGIADELAKEFPDADFIVQEGGQPLYYFYFSVE